jgi:hypothetical protein
LSGRELGRAKPSSAARSADIRLSHPSR